MPDVWIRLAGVLAASTIAVAGGIQLGRATIAEINPAYFRSPESTRFFADLVPSGYDVDGQQYASADPAWAYGRVYDDTDDCRGCEPGQVPATPDYQLSNDIPEADERLPGAEREFESSFEIERYANFPVTREEEQRSARSNAKARIVVETAQTAEEHVEAGEPVGM